MTEPAGCCDPGNGVLRADLDDIALRLSVAGFAAVWQSHALPPALLLPNEADLAAETAAALATRGRAELDDDGCVLGIHGLTLRRGRHSFTHHGTTRWTWCGFDSIGIPAALRLTAITTSDCPTCGSSIAVHIRDGGVDDKAAVLWLPAPRPSGHLMNDFCSSADLYCSTNHLEARARRGPEARAVSLSDALELGRETWSDIIDVDLATFVAGPGSAR